MSPTISQLGAIAKFLHVSKTLSATFSRRSRSRFWQVSGSATLCGEISTGGKGFLRDRVAKWIRKGIERKRWCGQVYPRNGGLEAIQSREGTSFICQMLLKRRFPPKTYRVGVQAGSTNARLDRLRERSTPSPNASLRSFEAIKKTRWRILFRGVDEIVLRILSRPISRDINPFAGERCNGIDSGAKLNQVLIIRW